jgi:hypothetical protein
MLGEANQRNGLTKKLCYATTLSSCDSHRTHDVDENSGEYTICKSGVEVDFARVFSYNLASDWHVR